MVSALLGSASVLVSSVCALFLLTSVGLWLGFALVRFGFGSVRFGFCLAQARLNPTQAHFGSVFVRLGSCPVWFRLGQVRLLCGVGSVCALLLLT